MSDRQPTSLLVPLFLVCLICLPMALGIESWPFSSYPMYSHPRSMEEARVARFVFRLESGERVYWKPRFSYIGSRLGDLLLNLHRTDQRKFQQVARDSVEQILLDLSQEEETPQISSVHLMLRRVEERNGRLRVRETSIFSVEVDQPH